MLLVILAGLVMALSAATSPAIAQQSTAGASAPTAPATGGTYLSVADIERQWPRLTPKQQFLAIEQLVRGAQFETAGRLLAQSRYSHAGDRAIQRFYLGLVARGQGRSDEAVRIFREVLAERPELTRVRLELAQTLFQMKEDDSARHHFELVLGSSASQPGLDTAVRSYLNAIDGRKRWDFTTFFSLAPSTNVNQGASTRTVSINGLPFELAERNLKQSGIGVTGGFQAGYRHPLTDSLDLVLAGGAQTKRFKEQDFNEGLINASVGPRWRFGAGFIGLYATADHRWVADDDYASSFGGLVSAGLQISSRNLVYADVGCSRRSYDTDWRDVDMSHQDGHLCFLGGRLDHHIDSRTFLRLLGNLGREDAGLDHLDSRTWSAGAGIYREITWGISLYLQALRAGVDFKGLYPGFPEARQDERWDFSVNVTKRDLEILGFAPMLQYTYTTNDSNIPFHVYDAHGVNLTLTKRF